MFADPKPDESSIFFKCQSPISSVNSYRPIRFPYLFEIQRWMFWISLQQLKTFVCLSLDRLGQVLIVLPKFPTRFINLYTYLLVNPQGLLHEVDQTFQILYLLLSACPRLPNPLLRFHKASFRGFPVELLAYCPRISPWDVPVSTPSIHCRFFECRQCRLSRIPSRRFRWSEFFPCLSPVC